MDTKNKSSNPIRLYRYLPDKWAIQSIKSRSFRVSRLSKLNDPFECGFGYIGCPDLVAQQLSDDHIAKLDKDDGIICFSKEIKDPILWSHYAKVGKKVHKGIAFEVKGDVVLTTDRCFTLRVNGISYEKLHQVAYNQPRITFDLSCKPQLTDLQINEKASGFFSQKSRSWHYEKEYRLVVNLAKCRRQGEMFFWKIRPGFISRVIIGFRSSKSVKDVRRELDLHGFKKTRVAKAKLSQTTYKVEVIDVA